MSYKNDQSFYILLVKIFILISVVGVGVLVYTGYRSDLSTIAFPLIAFIISVAALVMTTLQSLSIARQVRVTQQAARVVNEASRQIELLVNMEHKVEQEIRQDIKLDHEIIAVLEEFGIGQDDTERIKVATQIAKKVEKND